MHRQHDESDEENEAYFSSEHFLWPSPIDFDT